MSPEQQATRFGFIYALWVTSDDSRVTRHLLSALVYESGTTSRFRELMTACADGLAWGEMWGLRVKDSWS